MLVTWPNEGNILPDTWTRYNEFLSDMYYYYTFSVSANMALFIYQAGKYISLIIGTLFSQLN